MYGLLVYTIMTLTITTQTINTVMEPTAAKAVKGWLKGADHKGIN